MLSMTIFRPSFSSPAQEVSRIVKFIQTSYSQQGFSRAVIAVSGGIDSAVALSLLSRSLPKSQIFPIFLPYQDQAMTDSRLICNWNQIPEENWQLVSISDMADAFIERLQIGSAQTAGVSENGEMQEENKIKKISKIRRGNVMARCRMIVVYDLAKKLSALVCGTENKSERLLGYFTRFGDGASDIEPLVHLYKTEVRQLAAYLQIPDQIQQKPPSADLWSDQTDESELGFSYEQADQVLQLLEQVRGGEEREREGGGTGERVIPELALPKEAVPKEIIDRVVSRVENNRFKRVVPYSL